jgi:uncharacterized damage-inducible protein DinB
MIRKLAVLAALSCTPFITVAQTPAAPSTTPISDTVRQGLARAAKNMTAAAEAMPADKYSYKPTPDQMSFAHLQIHIADSNNLFCSKLSGTAAPEGAKLAETDSKEKLVAAVKASFDFCSSSLAKMDDSHLTDTVPLFGGRSFPRVAVMFILYGSWADHYSAQSMYLRLNGVLPPTAEPVKH